jgi:hypothetical protein
MKIKFLLTLALCSSINLIAQNYSFNFNSNGRRVCLVSSKVNSTNGSVKVFFHDSLSNTNEPIDVSRRLLGNHIWESVATNLPGGTGHWIDNNVNVGETWEYQVRRENTWSYAGNTYDAIGYTLGTLLPDNSGYKGQMILLVSNDIPINFDFKFKRLKRELTNDGWFVNELIVPRATNWDSGNEVVTIKNQIVNIFNNASSNDKPKAIFILGHVPLPRSGSTLAAAPDDHDQNKGARGSDGYYADIDGIFTDTATFNPGGLSSTLAINLPGDFKWDQDFFPSDLEMTFGRIDFADLTEITVPELTLIENYLDRLSQYKNVATGFDMGDKSGFYLGYSNSNDGSYRSLINISKPENVYQKTDNSIHNQWVEQNGPFKIYMQNQVLPDLNDWQTYGMNATVYSSDQSYWGFGDVPQPSGVYSRIRTLLGIDSKCLVALWTTTGLNIFHQACNGQSVGLAMKEIMNHNEVNQYLEKPVQQYDTPEWWNRTHFEIWGDPTLNLYQVAPITNLSLNEVAGNALLQWSPSLDNEIQGYNIYESDNEFGIYQMISTSTISDTFYQIPNYSNNHWYMVKAIKEVESGCGKFLHSSLGESIKGNLSVGIDDKVKIAKIDIFPNPSDNFFQLACDFEMSELKVFNNLGGILLDRKLNSFEISLDSKDWKNGIYLAEIKDTKGQIYFRKLVKQN